MVKFLLVNVRSRFRWKAESGGRPALRMSQRGLMDDVNTSHPFYWAAFAAVGDGEIPVIRPIKPLIAAAMK